MKNSIKDVKIFDNCLSKNEIRDLYFKEKKNKPGIFGTIFLCVVAGSAIGFGLYLIWQIIF